MTRPRPLYAAWKPLRCGKCGADLGRIMTFCDESRKTKYPCVCGHWTEFDLTWPRLLQPWKGATT